ncbi:tRNA threonylcarbamoyladenosine biosynthesis protein TsaE [Pseudoalteromonas holothuriae]|uniref:tRNA threonylcarbamoyladenosine biosynthesis protein TsaE n=1 Tax=Pseudoalteromonas holothuriae TaxID=2963714 RepID=A0A9W4VLI5_9GAMM|nr:MULTISPECIES: tRNA (adenosine(37)-N6)-threonylcarbamoyltransferase complex ATPase subunit type 1 TsaE [unclassified Pseudoalteromonas]CAH9049646.1 tRNA threonylcarbamoyladenosine biosynthesis protein TsaE [Pseudoalteromonas sp. CIP111854]CAH9051468.1 tRNA threonylcarbamoyladenosine biosynthesis protein TsaE [Pseudoalteromonas sp. CIP111951]
MSNTFSQHLADEAQTVAMGTRLCKYIKEGAVLFLHGDLGAGKTTLSRGIVQGMGHTGKVKSPTYTLVEPYDLDDVSIYHFDLYRLGDPEELEYMGIRDYFSTNAICIIEWPEKGHGFIPNSDLDVDMAYDGQQRIITLSANSERGQIIINQLGQDA